MSVTISSFGSARFRRPPESAQPTSRNQLFTYAAHSILNAVGPEGSSTAKTASTVRTALELTNYFLEDGAATPQATPDADGGVNVEWLVNGNSLVINCLSDSEVYIWAENADGTEIGSVETNSQWLADDRLSRLKEFLREMSSQVTNRIQVV